MTTSIKNNELSNCTFIKTILMILVVLGHSLDFWTGVWFSCQKVAIESPTIHIIANWIGSFHVYGFVLVSGYLFYFLKNEAGKYLDFKLFLKKKVKRLIVPYCFVMLIWVMPITAYLYKLSIAKIIDKYILCTSPSQLWFLWMLFDVFIIIWPLNNILKNNKLAILISILSWGIGMLGSLFLPNVFCIWTAFDYLPFFIIGMKIREGGCSLLYKIPVWIYLILDIALFSVEQYTANLSGTIAKVFTFGLKYAVHLAGALMAFFLLQKLADVIKWKNSRTFMFLSKRSMTIYLFHQQIIYFVIIWLNGKVYPFVNVGVCFVIAMTISIIISSILFKFKFTRLLIGEK